jgi:hypothetical protein
MVKRVIVLIRTVEVVQPVKSLVLLEDPTFRIDISCAYRTSGGRRSKLADDVGERLGMLLEGEKSGRTAGREVGAVDVL